MLFQGCSSNSAVRPSYSRNWEQGGSSPRYSDRRSSSSQSSQSSKQTPTTEQSTPSQSTVATTPSKPEEQSPSRSRRSKDIESVARDYIGVRYLYGGTTRRGLDCSGFVWRVFQDMGATDFSRTSSANYYKQGERVNQRSARKGDLVFFKTGGRISHMGIYLGDNKFIHSSSSRGVIESLLTNSYWKPKIAGFRRFPY